MFGKLKDHPFAVEAFFESSLVVTYAVPIDAVRPLIPDSLRADTFADKWAFIAVAMVQTRDLRPKGLPRLLGSDFFLIGYRVFVRFTTASGRELRGLYILRSATNSRRMEFFGNIFTHYNYSTIDVETTTCDRVTEIRSTDFFVSFDEPEDAPIPEGSPFPDWRSARKFAGPLPFTFTYNESENSLLIIEGVRQNWKPTPVRIIEHRFSFLAKLNLSEVRLANAFIIRDVPYYWKRGRKEFLS